MAFFLLTDETDDQSSKRVLLSDSLSSIRFSNLTKPVTIIISGVLTPSTITTVDLEISRDGENWSEVIDDIDFRVEFEPKIYVRSSENSSSGTVDILSR